MALMDEYEKGDVTRAIVDILHSDWSEVLKRNILTKELLWNIDLPRSVYGAKFIEPPVFSIKAKDRWISNIENGLKPKSDIRIEHAIPRTVLFDMLKSLKIIDYRSVRRFQLKYIKRAYVTVEEDRLLDQAKLRSKMPPGWKKSNVWARHHLVGIEHTRWIPDELKR